MIARSDYFDRTDGDYRILVSKRVYRVVNRIVEFAARFRFQGILDFHTLRWGEPRNHELDCLLIVHQPSTGDFQLALIQMWRAVVRAATDVPRHHRIAVRVLSD